MLHQLKELTQWKKQICLFSAAFLLSLVKAVWLIEMG